MSVLKATVGSQGGTGGGGITAITSTGGTITITNATGPTVNIEATGAASTPFNAILSGTNVAAAMVVGTGASLSTTGTGTIAATSAPAAALTGTTLAANVVTSSLTSVGTLGSLTVTNPISGSITGSSGSTTGNAATATTLATARTIAITGDLAYTSPAFDGSTNVTAVGTLATVNSTPGSFGSATQVATVTTNGKGLVTASGNITIQIAESQVTNLTTDLAAKQNNITLTTTGSSGAATLTGATLNIPNYTGTIYAAGTGLTLTGSTFSVNTSQSINTLSNLTTNGLVKTTGGTGALSIAAAGTDYLAPFTSQTANTFYAAPNGSAGLPSFRTIVTSDIPTGTSGAVIPLLSTANTWSASQTFPSSGGINIDGAASTNRSQFGKTSGSARWRMDLGNNTAESGSNAGSDYQLIRFDDTGTSLGSAFVITRATGNAAFTGTLTAPTFIGNVTGNTSGSAASFTGSLAGDVTGTQGATVVGKINGTSLAGLATGILKNTTTTGVPSIAVAGTDYQAPIILTTTGSSGAATFTGNTLNIPNYAGSSGTVSSVSVVSANGFAGTVATATTTPAITISTSVTGIIKGNGTALSAATAGTDYQAPITLTTTGTSGAATFTSNTLNIPNYANTTYSAGTGLTLATTTFSVNTSQNIATLSNLTTNGSVQTSGGTGALSVIANTGSGSNVLATSPTVTGISSNTYTSTVATGTAPFTVTSTTPVANLSVGGSAASFTGSLAGDVTGSQSATVVGKINGTSLAGLATGILKNTTTTGVPSIAVAGTDYQAPISLTTTGSGAATFTSNVLNIPTLTATAAAGSTGYVQYNNGGAFAATSNFFWDATNSRLGINQSTPTFSLEAVNTTSGNTFRAASNQAINQVVFENTAGAGNFKNQFSLRGNATERYSIGNDIAGAGNQNLYFYDSINIGTVLYADATGKIILGFKTYSGTPFVANYTADVQGTLGTTGNATIGGSLTINTLGGILRATSGLVSASALASGDIPNNAANTTGSAAKWTTARTLAGNSVDGSANVPFTNKFIVQGTTDAGLTGAQFLGALGTGLVKNTTTTGVLSIATAGTDYQAPISLTTTGSGAATFASNVLNIPTPVVTGITVGTAQVISTATTYDFTGIPSTAKRIVFNCQAVGVGTAVIPGLQMMVASAAVTTGYLGSTAISGGTSTANASTSNFISFEQTGSAAYRYNGRVVFETMGGNIWQWTLLLGHSDSARTVMGAGSISLSGVPTGIRLMNATAVAFAAGAANINYE